MPRRRLLLDLRPLRASADFRRLYLGGLVSQVGGMMTVFAVALQVYQLTRSSAAVGVVGLAAGVPTMVVGIAAGGLKLCYVVDAVSFAGALYGVARLPAMRPEQASGLGLGAVVDGLRFIAAHRPVLGALLSDLATTVLAFPVALFPAVNDGRFGGSPRTLGLLSAGLAVGGILGSMFSGRVSHTRALGRAMLVAAAVWGGALIGFGFAQSLAATLGWLVLAGVADVLSVVFRTALVQTATPDRFRGRVSAAESVVGAGGPAIGNFRAGVVASATSPGASAVIGGALGLGATVALAVGMPALRRWTTPDEPPPDEPAPGMPGHAADPASSATP